VSGNGRPPVVKPGLLQGRRRERHQELPLWSFTPLPEGGTRVRNTGAFVGLPATLLRPLAARRWNRDFQGAVDGLIRRAGSERADG
jgi:hypothetical protein